MIYPNEKDLSKLKQLDRIEYRQKIDNIEKNNAPYNTFTFLTFILGTVGLLALLSVGMYNINSSSCISFSFFSKTYFNNRFFLLYYIIYV